MSNEWLAGLLEGEGCFYMDQTTPGIVLTMTDHDVVQRVADMWGVSIRPRPKGNKGNKLPWVTAIHGGKAMGVMFDVFPYMGERRRQKIEEILYTYEHKCKEVVWRKR